MRDIIDKLKPVLLEFAKNGDPKQEVYLRFGNIPESGRSTIGRAPNYMIAMALGDRREEYGVSVYPIEWRPELNRWAIDYCSDSGLASLDELLSQKRPALMVTGTPAFDPEEEMAAYGVDGEPLLTNVRVIREMHYSELWVGAWGSSPAIEDYLYDDEADLSDEMNSQWYGMNIDRFRLQKWLDDHRANKGIREFAKDDGGDGDENEEMLERFSTAITLSRDVGMKIAQSYGNRQIMSFIVQRVEQAIGPELNEILKFMNRLEKTDGVGAAAMSSEMHEKAARLTVLVKGCLKKVETVAMAVVTWAAFDQISDGHGYIRGDVAIAQALANDWISKFR